MFNSLNYPKIFRKNRRKELVEAIQLLPPVEDELDIIVEEVNDWLKGIDPKSYGYCQRAIRIKNTNLSLNDLADFMCYTGAEGVSRASLSRIERNEIRPPHKSVIDSITFHLRCTPAQREQLYEAARYTLLRNGGFAE